jgi:hypothetical protein
VDENSRAEHCFVVRVWREPGARRCRGYIVHVSTTQRLYFSELADLLEFIRRRFELAAGSDSRDANATADIDDLGWT